MNKKTYKACAIIPASIAVIDVVFSNPDGGTSKLIMVFAFSLLAVGLVSSAKLMAVEASIYKKVFWGMFVSIYISVLICIVYFNMKYRLGLA